MRAVASALIIATAVAAGAFAADPLSLTVSENPVTLGREVTFTFAPPVQAKDDVVTFSFGDGDTGSVAFTTYCGLFGGCGTISHTYSRLGTVTVTANGTVGGRAVSGSLVLVISGGSDRFVLASAHAQGEAGTVWRTDVEVYNPDSTPASYTISLLKRDTDNRSPATASFDIPGKTVVRHTDILQSVFAFTGAAALRITPTAGEVLVTSRTYNLGGGGTYGQFVPALKLADAYVHGKPAFLLQLSHDPSLHTGFRTNVGLVNPSPAPLDVQLTFFAAPGVQIGTKTVTLLPLEFRQIDKAFELVTGDVVNDGFVRVDAVTTGGIVFTYASVVDNITGDPTLIPPLGQ